MDPTDTTLIVTLAGAAALALLALLPLLFGLRRASAVRGRRDAAIALHRAQLAELDRELAAGRLGQAEHASATLEVQRRLLAAASSEDNRPRSISRVPLVATLIAVPAAAFALYLYGGHPDLPAAPLGPRIAAAKALATQDDALIAALRTRLGKLDPSTPEAHRGYVLLGGAEAARGHYAAAAAAWRTALAQRWNPKLAAEVAEAQTRADGRVTAATRILFERALKDAPKDAPWRKMVEERLK